MTIYRTEKDKAIAREIISCPGDTLAEHLEFTGMTSAQLAEWISLSQKNVNEIIQGKAKISSEIAIQLERAVGIPADLWMELEYRYRIKIKEIKDAEILLDINR
ncbi:MAG TPA: HigA family addiction module antitoxin [Chlorobaculum sp.]|nr:HigA family addiction module antitoxin [Chlorobaculum sp.]